MLISNLSLNLIIYEKYLLNSLSYKFNILKVMSGFIAIKEFEKRNNTKKWSNI